MSDIDKRLIEAWKTSQVVKALSAIITVLWGILMGQLVVGFLFDYEVVSLETLIRWDDTVIPLTKPLVIAAVLLALFAAKRGDFDARKK